MPVDKSDNYCLSIDYFSTFSKIDIPYLIIGDCLRLHKPAIFGK